MTAVATPLAVVNIAEQRAAAFIRRGQRAWTEIKKTAEEQRTLWLEVGVALMYGKLKENRDGLKFSEWCNQKFPGIDTKNDVPAALWFASDFPSGKEIPAGMSSPQHIRQWFNEQQDIEASPIDGPEIAVAPAPKFAALRDATKFIKLDQRAESGDEGADTADRMRRAVAKAHDTTVEDLRKEAARVDPDSAYRFSPSLQLSIDRMRDSLRNTASSMEASGISRDAIRDLFIQFANTL